MPPLTKKSEIRTCLRVLAIALFSTLSACSDSPPPVWSGYAEGDYVYIAAPLAGRLDTVTAVIGQTVAAGAPLFTLDAESEIAAQDEAQARFASARAQAANLDQGKRSEEIAVVQAQLAQARTAQAQAYSDLQRQQQLVTQGFVSQSRADDAASQWAQWHAKVAELTAALQVAKLPARQDERSAQRANAQAAAEVLRQSAWRTRQKQQRAPVTALVADVFFQVGEYIPAGQPVVSLLPPDHTKVRFFVPEAALASVHPGQAVEVRCDGCGAPMQAHITRIATQPEYTPPLIYSNAQRSKLVFMVEAQPDAANAARLKPGQPLEVRSVATPSVAQPPSSATQ